MKFSQWKATLTPSERRRFIMYLIWLDQAEALIENSIRGRGVVVGKIWKFTSVGFNTAPPPLLSGLPPPPSFHPYEGKSVFMHDTEYICLNVICSEGLVGDTPIPPPPLYATDWAVPLPDIGIQFATNKLLHSFPQSLFTYSRAERTLFDIDTGPIYKGDPQKKVLK